LEDYVNKPFLARPDPNNPKSERKAWRAILGLRTATSMLVADEQTITDRLRAGYDAGFDSIGNPIRTIHGTLPIVKFKVKWNKGTKRYHVQMVHGRQFIDYEQFAVGLDQYGKANHFESAEKLKNRGPGGR